jgi:hypothetical protein
VTAAAPFFAIPPDPARLWFRDFVAGEFLTESIGPPGRVDSPEGSPYSRFAIGAIPKY